ncbi:MAG: MoxR family ATPase [Ardenticatenaceae bacterium]|nr:MoxR family ATPase [Ardenticatenaceae bacterium]
MTDSNNSKNWFIYGNNEPQKQLKAVIEKGPPSWRNFEVTTRRTAYEFQIGQEELEVVNTAIYLRRPLLVTGDPGTGKSSLAYSIAEKLGLGKVLTWPITSRSILKDALYRYDAIGRLQDANLIGRNEEVKKPPIEKYLTLGPLGTALADSQEMPRVLLLDEIDKSDIDLPNDLLYIFEEGEFEIPELSRLGNSDDEKENSTFHIRKHHSSSIEDTVKIERGRVQCKLFPIVIMTSNGERELPAPFLRRCLRLDMKRPNQEKLEQIVAAHFGNNTPSLDNFIFHVLDERNKGGLVATDQLMNAIYLAKELVFANNASETVGKLSPEDEKMIVDIVLKSISRVRR